MKRIITLSLIAVSLLFTQCKKTSDATENDSTKIEAKVEGTEENRLAVEGLKGLPTDNLKRMAFGALTPVERYLLWIDNIKTVSAKFTPAQKALAVELALFLKPSLFTEGGKHDLSTFSAQWLAKAEVLLSPDQIRALAYNIGGSTTTVSVNNTGLKVNLADPNSPKDCNCNAGAYFTCDGKSFCGDDPEHTYTCTPSSWGCGFGWVNGCNNLCKVPGVDPEA